MGRIERSIVAQDMKKGLSAQEVLAFLESSAETLEGVKIKVRVGMHGQPQKITLEGTDGTQSR